MASHEWIPPETVQSTILAPDDGPSIQYLAGFWDGEGCFSATIPKEDGNIVQFLMNLTVTKESQVNMYQSRFGGKTGSYEPQKDTHSKVWYWQLPERTARIATESLEPFLEEKREQAQVFIEAIKYKQSCKIRNCTNDQLETLKDYSQQIRSMNSAQRKYAGGD